MVGVPALLSGCSIDPSLPPAGLARDNPLPRHPPRPRLLTGAGNGEGGGFSGMGKS